MGERGLEALAARVRRPTLEVAILTGGAAAITFVAVAFAGLRFAHAAHFVPAFAGLLLFLAALSAYQRVRMPENVRTIKAIDMIAVYLAMAILMMIFQYALACAPAYEISHLIEDADHAIGFRWLAFSQTVHALPGLSETFGFCYHNWMREFLLLIVALAATRQFEELEEFTAVYIIAGMSTLAVSGLLDAKSFESVAAYAVSGVHIPSGVSPEYLEKISRLRAGADNLLDLDRIIGLVSFPSFHAGAALLLAVYSRKLAYVWPLFLAFNLCILVGTITEGGHNFLDVVAGCAFAIVGVAAGQALRRSGGLGVVADRLAGLPAFGGAAARPQRS